MKKVQSAALLESLQADTREIILAATYLQQEDPGALEQPPAPGRWSAAQAIEHLNSYGHYYLPAIRSALQAQRPGNSSQELYKAGWLGDYFTKAMLPRNGQVNNKMQAPKGHRPEADVESKKVLDTFLAQQHQLLELLEQAKSANISEIRIPISLSKLVKLKLGDTFRFLVAHHQRHFVQVRQTLEAVKALQEYVQ